MSKARIIAGGQGDAASPRPAEATRGSFGGANGRASTFIGARSFADSTCDPVTRLGPAQSGRGCEPHAAVIRYEITDVLRQPPDRVATCAPRSRPREDALHSDPSRSTRSWSGGLLKRRRTPNTGAADPPRQRSSARERDRRARALARLPVGADRGRGLPAGVVARACRSRAPPDTGSSPLHRAGRSVRGRTHLARALAAIARSTAWVASTRPPRKREQEAEPISCRLSFPRARSERQDRHEGHVLAAAPARGPRRVRPAPRTTRPSSDDDATALHHTVARARAPEYLEGGVSVSAPGVCQSGRRDWRRRSA